MSTLREVQKEILDLTAALIEVGLSIDKNFPSKKIHSGGERPVVELSVTNAEEISIALKKRPYAEIYSALREKRAYNICLIDGALIQFRYRFCADKLSKHVLAFYPSPDLLEYQNDPELYETDILYADLIQKDIVTTPIRFDYDEDNFVENIHPKSHFTMGQYKNCRLPVASALTPFRFLKFILQSFYNTPFHSFCLEWRGTASDFPLSVVPAETRDLYLSYDT